MSDDANVWEFAFDTFTNKQTAEDELHKYAAMLFNAGLTKRFRVSVKPDYFLDERGNRRYDRPPTWDIVLTDHFPGNPVPDFLNATKFRSQRRT